LNIRPGGSAFSFGYTEGYYKSWDNKYLVKAPFVKLLSKLIASRKEKLIYF